MPEVLVGRHKRLSFMKVGETFKRMTKFTNLAESKQPMEYSRQYVDQATESTDLVGYATSYAFSFDRHTDNDVHDHIAEVIDKEMLGTDAQVDIVTVDIFDNVEASGYKARKRTFSIIPDSVGDGTDALIYSGNFKAVSDIEEGTATSDDNWQTVSFVSSAE